MTRFTQVHFINTLPCDFHVFYLKKALKFVLPVYINNFSLKILTIFQGFSSASHCATNTLMIVVAKNTGYPLFNYAIYQ